jgi:hypothetical protein
MIQYDDSMQLQLHMFDGKKLAYNNRNRKACFVYCPTTVLRLSLNLTVDS